MRLTLLLLSILAFSVPTLAQRWEYHHDGPAHTDDEYIWCCAVEKGGNGYYGGEDRSPETEDFLVVALSQGGAERWTDNDSAGRVEDICIGEDGLVYAAGSVHDTAGRSQFTVVCYDRLGHRRWQYKAHAADGYAGRAYAVCPRAGNGVFVGGWVDFPDDWYQFTVAALDSSGNVAWFDTLGARGLTSDEVRDIAVGSDGNVYACGMLSPDSVFPRGAVVSFTPEGAVRWRAWPEVSPTSICAGEDGNLYVGGNHDSLDRPDLTVVSVSPTGAQRWRYSYDAGGRGALDMDHVKDVVWGDGNVYAGGQACRDDDYIDAFIVSLDPQGGERWQYWFRGSYNFLNWVNELVFTPDGYIHGAGLMCSLLSSVAEWCLTPGGDTVWVFKRDSEGVNSASAQCIDCDSAGNVYMGGTRYTDTRDAWTGSLSRPQAAVGGSDADCANAVVPLGDSGFMVAGETRSFGAGSSDGWILRLDSQGDTLWTRTAGGSDRDLFRDLVACSDGGATCAGETDGDPWLVRFDSAGGQTWDRTYRVPDFGRLHAVHREPAGGFVLAGSRYNGTQYMYGLVIGTDSAGNEVWRTELGEGSNYNHLAGIAACPDGDWLLVGRRSETPMGRGDLWLVRVDSVGDTLWTRTFGGSHDEWGEAIVPTAGGYRVVGTTRSFGPGSYNVWLLAVDESGDTLWTRTWGVDDEVCRGRDIVEVPGSGYAVTGDYENWSGADALLLETDGDGNELELQCYGGESTEHGNGICLAANGGYCIVGSTLSFGTAGSEDVYVVTTASGVGVAEPRPDPVPRARGRAGPASTIVRGTLMLGTRSGLPGRSPVMSRATLLDITGRKVLDLMPGPNDVSYLGSGVYFLKPSADSGQPVRKVILQR